MKQIFIHYTSGILILLLYSFQASAAKYYYSTSTVVPYSGCIPQGTANKEVLRIDVTMTSSGGSNTALVLNTLQFTIQNTSTADVTNADLYYNTSSTMTGATWLAAIASPAGTITFTPNHSVLATNAYYFLVFDVSGSATWGNNLDAFVPAGGFIYSDATPVTNQPITPGNNNPSEYLTLCTQLVTSSASSGAGTLAEAITNANSNAGADYIAFDIPGAGPSYSISLTSALPSLTDATGGTTIDGYTQAGASPNIASTGPLNGTLNVVISNGTSIERGLDIRSQNNVIKGLVFSYFGSGAPVDENDGAIRIAAPNNKILGCYIGTNYTGTSETGNSFMYTGIYLDNAGGNTIGDGTAAGRNLISGTYTTTVHKGAILLDGANCSANIIKGNFIGLASNGTAGIYSSQRGIYISSASGGSNTVGGTAPGDGNVILGVGASIGVYRTNSSGEVIMGNIMGMQYNGNAAVSSFPQNYGIYIEGSPNNTIGGNISARNYIACASLNNASGIYITGSATGNLIKSNYIGVNSSGTAIPSGGNQQSMGVNIQDGNYNSIENNLISGHLTNGIYLKSGGVADHTLIKGNILGLQANGSSLLGSGSQSTGINMNSANNTVGGVITSASDRNVISGNTGAGMYVAGNASGNLIKGNYVGTADGGTATVSSGSQDYGIWVASALGTNTIGGDRTANEYNLISGNDDGGTFGRGIYLSNSSGGTYLVTGNIIGTKPDGTWLTNVQDYGIHFYADANHTIGGTTAGARNIISCNDVAGIRVAWSAGSLSTIIGNYIGTNLNGDGLVASSSQDYGIYVNTANITIGGSNTGERNLISGNSTYGIYLLAGGRAVIKGNIIGPEKNGTATISPSTTQEGIYMNNSPNNTVGGAGAGDKNLISGNENYGIWIDGTSSGNVIKHNFIGPDINGAAYLSNSQQNRGIHISGTANSNTIGSSVSGEGNVVSGNWDGQVTGGGINVAAESTSSLGNTFIGNTVGPASGGTSSLASPPAGMQQYGFYIENSPNNTVGGNTSSERNLITANRYYGVYIGNTGGSGNVIKGNYIGMSVNGTSVIPFTEQDYGIYINTNAAYNTIGGTDNNEGNLISGNADGGSGTSAGVYINGSQSNFITGNLIGPQSNGNDAVASNQQFYGIYLSGASNNTIGNTTGAGKNVISGNNDKGIWLISTSTGNVIRGNYIGLASNGTSLLSGTSTQVAGVLLDGAVSNTVGGAAVGHGNVVSGHNSGTGVELTNGSNANHVYGNYVGPQNNGSLLISGSSQVYGIAVTAGSYGNFIGGYAAGKPNTIAFNTTNGVHIDGAGSSGNLISRNPIYNTSAAMTKAINLNGTGNSNYLKPNISGVTASSVSGTAINDGDTVEVFLSDAGCINALQYLGSDDVSGGSWEVTGLSLSSGDYVIADVRNNGNNNTSEFCNCALALPVQDLNLEAELLKNLDVLLSWHTSAEINNFGFEIARRSAEETEFSKTGFVFGNGTTQDEHEYDYTDKEDKQFTVYYYRLKQINNNGGHQYSNTVEIRTDRGIFADPGYSGDGFSVLPLYPNPANAGNVNLEIMLSESGKVHVSVYDMLGKKVSEVYNEYSAGKHGLTLDLSQLTTGKYMHSVRFENSYQNLKIGGGSLYIR